MQSPPQASLVVGLGLVILVVAMTQRKLDEKTSENENLAWKRRSSSQLAQRPEQPTKSSNTKSERTTAKQGKGDGVWSRLDTLRFENLSFVNITFHEAVNQLLNEVNPDSNRGTDYRICLDKRELTLVMNSRRPEEHAERLLDERFFIDEKKFESAVASEVLITLCDEAGIDCCLTLHGLLFDVRETKGIEKDALPQLENKSSKYPRVR